MACRIEWSDTAKQQYQQVIEYLKTEWSVKDAENFIERVNKIITLISRFPGIGRKSVKRKRVRKYLLTRQNMLFYEIKKNTIFLLAIYDTRQNPDKIKY
ncbi:MAG: type II toxin-antitoxin system RelE/ParE family toxin [Cytophagales bacterium]|nr:type II toxin-antitoxin system RelE/ParE family toxin [Cytophagales bacterium]